MTDMLNKIENISTNTDFTRSPAKNTAAMESVYSNSRKFNFNDSFTFSSAFVLLSKINWKLRKFKLEHNRIVHIEFSAYGIIFSTTIDISDQEDLYKANYILSSLNEETGSFENLFVQILFSVADNPDVEGIIPLDFPACYDLLHRVKDKARYSQSEFWQSNLYEDFLSIKKSSIYEELSLLHHQVLVFIEMLTGNSLLPLAHYESNPKQEMQIKNIFKLNE